MGYRQLLFIRTYGAMQSHKNIVLKSETLIALCAFRLRDVLSAIKDTETIPLARFNSGEQVVHLLLLIFF